MKQIFRKLASAITSPQAPGLPPQNYPRFDVEDVLPDPLSIPYGLEIWHSPNQDESVQDDKIFIDNSFDIIFVHGLTGDRLCTWTAHKNGWPPWPVQVLPAHFPNGRIIAYGYDAYVALKKGPVSSNRLRNHSRDFLNHLRAFRRQYKARSLVFVAHSLGGLVCKDALLMASNSPLAEVRGICDSTVGICFMGTPHAGSDIARWAKIPVVALGYVKNTNKSLLQILETAKETIDRLQHDFMELVKVRANTDREIDLV